MNPEHEEAGPRKMIGRASVAAAGTVYQQAIAFLSGLIVARVIGAAEYGIFNLARNLLDLAAIVTRLGLEVGLQRYFGESKVARDQSAHVAVLRRLRVVTGTLATIPLLAVALGAGRALETHVYQYPHFGAVLLCLALALPFMTDIAVLGGAYRGVFRLSAPVLAECILLPTIRLAAILLLFLAGWRLWAVVAGTVLGSLLASLFLARRAQIDFPASKAPNPSWDEALHVMRYSSVLAGAVLVVSLTSSMDVLMLGRFATAADLGQYSLAKTLLVLMGVFGIAFSQGLGGLVAERHARGDRAAMVRVMALNTRLVTLLTLPVFAMFLFWGAQLMRLFGPSFVMSQPVVSWLAAAQYVFIVFGPAGWALSMTGRHVLELKILLVGLAASALLCWLAIPAYGQLGAAIAMFASVCIANILRLLFVRQLLGSFSFRHDIPVITATGIALAWICSMAAGLAGLPPAWNAVSGAALFFAAYSTVCWMHLLTEAERTGIRAMFDSTIRKVVAHGH